MIKTNEYYASVYGRTNKVKQAILSYFFSISSTPRIFIEIFLRREMGIRYFSLFHCICLGAVLFALPFLMPPNFGLSLSDIILSNWGWYLYLIAFAKCSWDRSKESSHPYGYFDFNHFSLSTGKHIRFVDNFRVMGKPISARAKDVYLEPLLAVGVGILAFLTHQWMVGALLIICSGIYSMSYRAAYEMGRTFFLDKIDEDLVNRGVTDFFLNDKPKPSNFNFYGPKPSASEVRQGLAALFGGKDQGADVK